MASRRWTASRHAIAWASSVLILTSGCSLVTSFDGFAGGGGDDGGAEGGVAWGGLVDGGTAGQGGDSSGVSPQNGATGSPGAAGGDSSATLQSADAAIPIDGSPDPGESDGGLSDDSGSCSICFVQAAAGGGTKGSTVSVAFANGVGAGDAIIVAVALGAGGGATLSQVTDSLGNTYQIVVTPATSPQSDTLAQYIAFASNVLGGTDTVTVTLSSTTYFDVYIHEYSGVALANAFDVGAAFTGTSDATNAMASGFATTQGNSELIFGFGTSHGTVTPGTGFTGRSTFDGNLTEDMIAVTPGSYQATATSSNGNWAMSFGAFLSQ